MNTGIVRATVNDGRSIRVYFVDDKIPDNHAELFSNYGSTTVEKIVSPYLEVTCRSKRLAQQAEQYARKLDTWDTHEVINWAQNDEPLYLECDRLARKYKDKPMRAQSAIHRAIVNSGILKGTGVSVRRVDWRDVADTFLSSI